MHNPLNEHPKVREVAYDIWWGVSGVVGVALTVYTAQGDVPNWLNWVVAAVAFSGTYLGFTAKHNVTGNDIQGKPVTTKEET